MNQEPCSLGSSFDVGSSEERSDHKMIQPVYWKRLLVDDCGHVSSLKPRALVFPLGKSWRSHGNPILARQHIALDNAAPGRPEWNAHIRHFRHLPQKDHRSCRKIELDGFDHDKASHVQRLRKK